MNKPGIYCITNRANGKRYVGSTLYMQKRLAQHRSNLKCGRHPNPHLRNAHARHGNEAFAFSPVIYCEPSELIHYEQRLIDLYGTADRQYGYNIGPADRHTHSEESKRKISAANKGRKWTPEMRAKLRVVRKQQVITAETRAKMGLARRGVPRKPETKAKLSESIRAKWQTDVEYREKVTSTHIGVIPSNVTRERMRVAVSKRRRDEKNRFLPE